MKTSKRTAQPLPRDPMQAPTPALLAALKAAGGSDDPDVNMEFTKRAFATAWPLDGARTDREAMIALGGIVRATMAAFKPTDAVEGMLVAQIVGLHQGAMESMRRAVLPDQNVAGAARSWKDAASLSRVMLDTLACLERHRQQAGAATAT